MNTLNYRLSTWQGRVETSSLSCASGCRIPPTTPEHLELELAPENYRLKLSSLPKVCPDKNFKFRVTGHRHPLEPAT